MELIDRLHAVLGPGVHERPTHHKWEKWVVDVRRKRIGIDVRVIGGARTEHWQRASLAFAGRRRHGSWYSERRQGDCQYTNQNLAAHIDSFPAHTLGLTGRVRTHQGKRARMRRS